MSLDAQTISAFAAGAAAAGAFTVAGIQLYVGYRQSKAALQAAHAAEVSAQSTGRHTVAEFRQAWIYKVIDTLSEQHAILMARATGGSFPDEDRQKLPALRTRLELLLNPDETDHVALLKAIDEISASTSVGERLSNTDHMVSIARRLLKREWVRLKSELTHESEPSPPA
jgi:hypothetical protein